LRVRYEMAPYDSDSSDGEENDYTVTNVLLGYTSNEAKDDNISHLGGSPVC
jgi:pre-rRNA-processing protein TSR4